MAVRTTRGAAERSAVRTVDLDALARVGTALADDTRRRLLVELLHGAAYPAELADALGLTRSNVSNHLSCLRGCGLVTVTPEGRRSRYELADDRLAHALQDLCALSLHPDVDCGPQPARGTVAR